MNHQPILDLMADFEPRTSYQICDALFGPQPDGRKWYRVAATCDAMVTHHQLRSLGKRNHRTVYVATGQGATLEDQKSLDTGK